MSLLVVILLSVVAYLAAYRLYGSLLVRLFRLDPEAKTLERLVLDGSTYRVVDALADQQTFAPPSFAGLSISLRTLWVLPE